MKFSNFIHKAKLFRAGAFALLLSLIVACNPSIDERYVTTFTGEMIYTQLEKDSLENFSEFLRFIDHAGLKGMLSAYGDYTCLAPTNQALAEYYASRGDGFKFEDLEEEEIDYIARTHIVNYKYMTENLADGVIPNVNMNDRVIEIFFTADEETGQLRIFLNGDSEVLEKDIEVHNGVIHTISKLLTPSMAQLPYLIANQENLTLFTEALDLTGLTDSLLLIEDTEYDHTLYSFKDEYESYEIPAPPSRKYGYTAFVETDDVFAARGILSIEDLINQAAVWYSNDPGVAADDYTHRGHSLNKFISYHLVEKIINTNSLWFDRSAARNIELYEFVETMYTNRIMKVANRSGMNTLPEGMKAYINPNSQDQIFVTDQAKTTVNGVFHYLTDVLLYTADVEDMIRNTRIRFDMTSLLPEMMNNNLRFADTQQNSSGDRYGIPHGYFKYVEQSQDTRFIYLASKDRIWHNYQGDEMMGLGTYDVTIRLLPVPPGTYELRFGYSGNTLRSVTQIYVDGKPVGIPLDLRMRKTDTKVGWVKDDPEDETVGFENDKAMRNRGFMDAPITMVIGGSYTPLRHEPYPMRRIVGIFTFDTYEPHYIRFRSVLENPTAQAQMDYFEFVPKSIYAPTTGEPEDRN